MDTAALKSFATWARSSLLGEVAGRIAGVLAPASPQRVEQPAAVAALEAAIRDAGGGDAGRAAVAEKVAYTWFNRIIALRFMDANGYTGIGVVSPAAGQHVGQPEVLAAAKRGTIDPDVLDARARQQVAGLLDGTRRSPDPQGEAYQVLLVGYCRHWNQAMPFMFQAEGDFTELLMPGNLLADGSLLDRAMQVLTPQVCADVEVIGWLYQFYIADRKDEVFAGFKKNKKAGAAEIPAATQLFTPHWIVRFLVENSLGRLWLLNHPDSTLADQMDYYIPPVDEETDYLRINGPEELTVIDPACGSGHMLTYAFDLLYAIYSEAGYAPADIPTLILTHNLYGTEIDQRAGSLAAFALTMKARAKQRTFLTKGVQPSICVIQPIRFAPHELDLLADPDLDRSEQDAFWNQFTHADTLGSLIQPDPDLTQRLAAHLQSIPSRGDLLTNHSLQRGQQAITQAHYLSQQYSVVVANPPYMGSRNFSASLSEWAGQTFPDSRTDLFAMFIVRGLRLVKPGGLEALITMETWMFIRAYEALREHLLSEALLKLAAHLGSHAFDAIAGELVGTVAFVVARWPPTESARGTFLRVVEAKGEDAKSRLLLQYARRELGEGRFEVMLDMIRGTKGVPLTYWLPAPIQGLLADGPSLDSVTEFPSSPHKTGDNERFLRKWWEVSLESVGVERRWVPYAKGGGARRWYGLVLDVVDWSPPALDFYRVNPSSSLMRRDPSHPEGITYSMLTMGSNTFRVLPAGYAYDMGGPGFFASGWTMPQVLGLVNSSMAETVLGALNPTINLQSRDVKRIPLPTLSPRAAQDLDDMARKAIALSLEGWAEAETSMEFEVSTLHRGIPEHGTSAGRLSTIVGEAISRTRDRARSLAELRGEIDRLVWESAGVEAVAYRNHRGTPDVQVDGSTDPQSALADLASYAVGCMFGRYSLDVPGLILADQGSTLQDYLARVPEPSFLPDADNVIPIVDGDWFDDDIVARFRAFLRAAFGEEHFEENLRFVTESLGVQDLRDYFVKSFCTDHVKRYKKRPIYWLFSSPKGSFNALIYLHRYTPSTVSTVLNEYLREYRAKLAASLQHHEQQAAGGGTPRQQAAARKEADRLRKVLLELEEYEHDVLYPLATQQLAIDLDDGVKANYPKFGAALKKIPGLEAKE